MLRKLRRAARIRNLRAVTLYDLKPRFQALLRPLVARLHDAGVTANAVTLGACAASIGLGLLLCALPRHTALFLLLPAFLFVRMALNAIDGMLAREYGHKSPLGAYLNELTDVVADAALYLPFAFLAHCGGLEVGVFVFLAALAEMTGALGPMVGATRRYDGPLGKSDRAFVLGALGLAVGLGLPPHPVLGLVFPALAVLLCVTIVNRVRRGLAELPARRSGTESAREPT
jgi:CDP-diacylglycerol--glycerol-3-phosphate 3-phosphatidyltransferase